MTPETPSLSRTTKTLHWTVAIGMITLIAVGIFMHETENFALYPIHKSFGVLIVFLALPRVIWRIKKGWPTTLGSPSNIMAMAAKAVHWLLLLATVIYPVSGMMMSGAGGHGIAVFGLNLLDSNYDAITKEAVPLNETLAGVGHFVHETFTFILIAAIVLHVVGAIKHHVIDKDATLKRMVS